MKRTVLLLLGFFFSVIPPAAATVSYFPLWLSRDGEAAVCGLAFLFLVLSLLPIMKYVRGKLRSPSVLAVWAILFVLFAALSKIADQITVISLFGLVGNLIGTLFFRLARRKRNNEAA